MSLSVEELKSVLTEFEIGNLAIFDDSDRPARGAERIAQAAIRELIAIKEAEPVGFLFIIEDDYVMADGAIEKVDFNYVTNEDDAKISGNEALKGRHMLIRKPE